MNRIIELAREAGAYDAGHNYFGMGAVTLERFYTLARADLEAELAAVSKTNAEHVPLILELMADNAKLKADLQKCISALKSASALCDRIIGETNE